MGDCIASLSIICGLTELSRGDFSLALQGSVQLSWVEPEASISSLLPALAGDSHLCFLRALFLRETPYDLMHGRELYMHWIQCRHDVFVTGIVQPHTYDEALSISALDLVLRRGPPPLFPPTFLSNGVAFSWDAFMWAYSTVSIAHFLSSSASPRGSGMSTGHDPPPLILPPAWRGVPNAATDIRPALAAVGDLPREVCMRATLAKARRMPGQQVHHLDLQPI